MRQTYTNRELLIVADREEDVRGLVPLDDRIAVVMVGAGVNVGNKRNIGCECALGDIIAVWDDDDYSAPARLTDQVNRLWFTGKEVTGYHTMKFTDGERWWIYRGGAGFVLATSLCFTRLWWSKHRFADMQVGQDELFGSIAAQHKQLDSQPDLDLMYATNHPGNTSPRAICAGSNWFPLADYQWKEAA